MLPIPLEVLALVQPERGQRFRNQCGPTRDDTVKQRWWKQEPEEDGKQTLAARDKGPPLQQQGGIGMGPW